jgi:hypothetical protein
MSKQKNAAIVIDSWKLPVFTKHLNESDFAFENEQGLVPETVLLKVQYEDLIKLGSVVKVANMWCTAISHGDQVTVYECDCCSYISFIALPDNECPWCIKANCVTIVDREQGWLERSEGPETKH